MEKAARYQEMDAREGWKGRERERGEESTGVGACRERKLDWGRDERGYI